MAGQKNTEIWIAGIILVVADPVGSVLNPNNYTKVPHRDFFGDVQLNKIRGLKNE